MNYEIDDSLYDPADLVKWLALHNSHCPRCGENLKERLPGEEIWPHMTGVCPIRNPPAASG